MPNRKNPLKRIVIDARMVGPVPHGFARYVSRLAEGLRRLNDEKSGLGYEPVFMVRAEPGSGSAGAEFFGFATLHAESAFLSPREWVEIPRLLRQAGAAFYHSPTFSSLWSCPCPWLLTVHDLNHLQFGGLVEKIYYRTLMKRFARGADVLMTVSDFSRDEIARWLKVDAADLAVVPNALDQSALLTGVNQETADAILRKWGLARDQYFFCLSNPKPHKNLPRLTQAFQQFSSQMPVAPEQRVPLVLSVDLPAGASAGVRGIGSVSDLEGKVLMQNSRAVFAPSLYEGFGLPPVEAAVLGARLVVSLIPPHQEGLQDLGPGEAIWVDPSDFHGWVSAFHRAHRAEFPRVSIESGRKILQRYSVERLGVGMDQIYRRVLEIPA